MVPIAEAICMATGPTTTNEDERHDEKADYSHDFKRSKPELSLAIYPGRERVQDNDDDDSYSDPDRHINWRVMTRAVAVTSAGTVIAKT